jgi:hypothetical protein
MGPSAVKATTLPNPALQRTWSSLALGTRPLNAKVVIRTSKRHSSRRVRLGCHDRDALNEARPGRVQLVRSLQTDR